jgi:hypothetical protein
MLRSLAASIVTAFLVVPAVAQESPDARLGAPRPELSQPAAVQVRAQRDLGPDALGLAFDPRTLQQLTSLQRVDWIDVPLAGYGDATLRLERARSAADTGWLHLDGEPVAPFADFVPADRSVWTGQVAGSLSSRVFLIAASDGLRGWIRVDGRTVHVLPENESIGDLRASRLVEGTAIAHLAPERLPCGTLPKQTGGAPTEKRSANSTGIATGTPPQASGQAPLPGAGPQVAFGAGTPTLEVELWIETDNSYVSQFPDTPSAVSYTLDLVDAASTTYELDTDIRIEVTGANIYSGADPWSGFDTETLLDELQAQWLGGLSAQGDGAILLSGLFGGGLAYLDALCGTQAVAVCMGVLGQTPFPVTQSPLNWDFTVFAHELGHLCGGPHTHDVCPPLDECATFGFEGPCQDGFDCPVGTVMSYCHLCGGDGNIFPGFHPEIAKLMREGALIANCVTTFPEVPPADPFAPVQIAGVSPDTAPAVAIERNVVTLFGSGFTNVNSVTLNGVPLGSLITGFAVKSDTEIAIWFQPQASLGAQTVEVFKPGSSDTAQFDLVANATPLVEVTYSLPKWLLWHSTGGLIQFGAPVGDIVFAYGSTLFGTSSLPGLATLDIGANFLELIDLGIHAVPATPGYVDLQIPLPLSIPIGTQIYVQGAVFSASTLSFPLTSTNIEIVELTPQS